MLTLTLMLTLVCVLMLMLMLVTAPLVGGRVVKRPPRGQVRTPPAPVRQDIIVEVVKIVVVRGVAVAKDAGDEVVEAIASMGVDEVVGLEPPRPRPPLPPRVTPRSALSVAETPRFRPEEPALRLSPRPASAERDTPRVTETPALTMGLPDGPRTTPPPAPAPASIVAVASMQALRMLPPFVQVVVGRLADADRVMNPDGSETVNEGMMVVAGSVDNSVMPGKSDDSTDETPFSTGSAT